MDWKDISIKKYLQLEKIATDESFDESEKMIQFANVIFDEDVEKIPLVEYNQKVHEMFELFKTEPDKVDRLADSYTVNGTKYIVDGDANNVLTCQFNDFQNYTKQKDIIGCISCFFIPEGHTYNDDKYDMLKVKEDIGDLPITVANALTFFFKSQYALLLILSQRYLLKQMKEMGMTKAQIKKMQDELANLGIANLVATLQY